MRAIAAAARNIRVEWHDFRAALTSRPVPKYNWDPMGARTFIHRFFHHLLEEHQSPAQVGWAVFWGILVGTTPLFGFHLIICLAIAFLLRLNKLIVYAAANISLPIFAPFLIFASYQTGHFLFQGSFAEVSVDSIKQQGVSSLAYWVIGSVIFGSALGALAGMFSFGFLRLLKRDEDQFKSATERLSHAFLSSGRMAAGLAKGKANGDPIYRMLISAIGPDQSILDLGGGQGYLCLLHKIYFNGASSHQVWDYDERKLAQGKEAVRTLGVGGIEYEKVDVFTRETIPETDVVCLLDVLHYQPVAVQNQLLERISLALKPGQKLYIRDMNADLKWRTRFTLLQERFSLSLGLTRAQKLYPRSGTELSLLLGRLGFAVELDPCWQGTPFSNIIITAIKQ